MDNHVVIGVLPSGSEKVADKPFIFLSCVVVGADICHMISDAGDTATGKHGRGNERVIEGVL